MDKLVSFTDSYGRTYQSTGIGEAPFTIDDYMAVLLDVKVYGMTIHFSWPCELPR
jgi:hypothetical protein